MTEKQEGLAASAIALGVIAALYLGAVWAIWLLYTAVIPDLFPDGPESVTSPGFLAFAGLILLVKVVFMVVRK